MKNLSFLLLLLLCTACQPQKPVFTPGPVDVTAVKISPENIPAVFTYVGRTESSHLVEIRARVEGYLEEIAYKEGTPVKKGDLLFSLDPKPFQTAVDNASAELNRQEAALWRADRDVERLKPLYEQKATSKKSLDDAISTQLGAKAAVESAKAQLEQAKINLGYTKIYSPITGLSESSKYRIGALITPGQNSLLTTISEINPMWVNFSVSEGDFLRGSKEIKQKRLIFPENLNFEVELILGDGSIYPEKGKLDFSSPSVDTSTGTFFVRATIPNPNNVLSPGQFVRARLLGAVRPNAILVPQKSVLQGANGSYVYVIKSDNTAEARSVSAGDWFGNDWIIRSGLDANDVVIVDGVNKVETGSPVHIISYVELKPNHDPQPIPENHP